MTLKHTSIAVAVSLLMLVGSTTPVLAKENNNNNNDNRSGFHFDFSKVSHFFDKKDDKKNDKRNDHKDDRDHHEDKDENDHHGGKGSHTGTVVSGTVYDGNHDPVSGGSIIVHCGSSTKSASIGSDGTYSASFSKSECKAGDTANASANTDKGSGSGSATVTDNGDDSADCGLDLAVIDITVPEFGLVGGVVSSAVSAAGYMIMRKK